MQPVIRSRPSIAVVVALLALVLTGMSLPGQVPAQPGPTATDPQLRLKWFGQHQAMTPSSPDALHASTWQRIRRQRHDPRHETGHWESGVNVTLDGGASWNVLGGSLPSTYVHDIAIHPRDRMIVAAPHGRGRWVMDAVPVQTSGR